MFGLKLDSLRLKDHNNHNYKIVFDQPDNVNEEHVEQLLGNEEAQPKNYGNDTLKEEEENSVEEALYLLDKFGSSPGICDIEPAPHQRSFTKGKHSKQIKHKDLDRKSSKNDTNILNNVFYPTCNDGS